MATEPSPPPYLAQSHPSGSPSTSQTADMAPQEVSLETLVSHLLASKRSLSSISTVWRANEIVTSARAALEESTILNAKTGFMRSGILGQIKTLRKVRQSIENVYKDGQRDFKNVIRTLDAANSRLESTMDTLRSTMVEAAFRPVEEEPRNLLDFVDEQGVETMRDNLKESIRESKEAQTEFDTSILAFDDDLRALKAALKSPSASQTNHELSSPIPSHLHNLEVNATEMASLLDSLVSHFDLCVNAIRHTEGGYAAVQKAASSQPPGADPVSVSGVMNTEQEHLADEPLSEEERKELLDVLEKDAAQVDDVVMDLRDLLSDMEIKHENVLEYLASLKTTSSEIFSAYQILEGIGARLSGYIIASQDFRVRWEDTKLNIQDQLNDLESMRIFYENYHSSYDGLILEVYRRKACEDKIKGILKRAMEQVEKVVEGDMKEREGFKEEVGEYLPVDLWPGVNDEVRKWGWSVKGEEGEEGEMSVPELEKGVVEGAGRRDMERRR